MALDYSAAWGDPQKAMTEGNAYVNSLFDRAKKVQDDAARTQAGQAFVQGDYSGAANALGNMGDIKGASEIQDYQVKQFQARHALLQQAVPVLSGIFAKGGPKAVSDAFEQIAPTLQQSGLDAPSIERVRQGLMTNPQQTLQVLGIGAQKQFTYQKLANGQIAAIDNEGNVANVFGPPETKDVAPGGSVFQMPSYQTGGGAPPAAAGGSMPAPPGAAPAAPAAGAGSPPVTAADASVTPPPGYAGRVAMNESGGNPTATNPLSSAAGNGQFIASTWLNLIRQSHPELANRSDAELLALRNNPALSGDMIEQYAAINGKALNAAGLPVNAATLYLAHGFGSDGAIRLLKSDPNAPVSGVMPPNVIAANPYLQKMSVGQLLQRFAAKMGGGAPDAATAAPPTPPVPTGGGRVMFTAPPKPGYRALTPAEQKQYPGAVQMSPEGKAEYPPQSAIAAGLSDTELQPYVDTLKAGGMLPTRLANNPAVYTKILKLAQDQGVPMRDILANQGNRKATQSTFNQINTRFAMVQSQEQAFQRSLALAYGLAQKAGPQGGGTLINGWRNYLKTGITGDPATGAFINAVNTAMNEYAKIIEGATGQGGSSVAARQDAQNMLSGADNIPAFIEKMNVLKSDAGFKIDALREQHDILIGALHDIGGSTAPSAPSGGGKVIRYDAKGNRLP